MECDFRRPRPDFCIHSPEPFLVEAAVALHAQGTPAVTETNPLDVPPNFKELNTQAIIRLSNTCIPNTRSIWNRTPELPHVAGKPFVLAIAPFGQTIFPIPSRTCHRGLLYRYYVDDDTYLRENPDRIAPLLAEDLPFVHKDSDRLL